MIHELFLSLLNGLSIFLGLNPNSSYFFAEKMGQKINPGFETACYFGLLNGIVLLWLKYRKETVDLKLIPYMAIPAVFYRFFCESYFHERVGDLRVYSWVFLGSVSLIYFFTKAEVKSEKLRLFIIVILAYASQIPGSATLLLLIVFLHNSKVPVKSAILLPVFSLLPVIVIWTVFSIQKFVAQPVPLSWIYVSISYLVTCFTLFWTVKILMLILKRKYQKLPVNAGLFTGVLLLFLTSRYGPNLSRESIYQFTFPSMGTSCEVTIWSSSENDAKKNGLKVKETIDSIEEALSTYKPLSEINKMNETAFSTPFKCSDILWENLILAEKAYRISHGGFDVTVGPLVKLWAIKKKRSEIPSKEEVENTLKKVGFDKIKLNYDDKSVRFLVEGLKIDFGGLTKGWAVDQASISLLKNGVNRFIVNLGGNLYCSIDLPQGKDFYKIGIKDPVKPEILCTTVDIKGQAVATSGNYEQFIMINGKRYTHIIDPRTGYPVANVDSVTVISPTATMCDILSTAIFVEGESLVHELEEKFPEVNVLFIDVKEGGVPRVIKNGLFKKYEIKIH